MSQITFNIAKGSVRSLIEANPDACEVILFKEAESLGTLAGYASVDEIKSGSNTEADFTNYARKTGLTATITQDDTNDMVRASIGDQTFTDAGGASNNSLVLAVVAVQTGTGDEDLVPLTAHQITYTTTGITFNLREYSDGDGQRFYDSIDG